MYIVCYANSPRWYMELIYIESVCFMDYILNFLNLQLTPVLSNNSNTGHYLYVSKPGHLTEAAQTHTYAQPLYNCNDYLYMCVIYLVYSSYVTVIGGNVTRHDIHTETEDVNEMDPHQHHAI